MSIKQQTDPQVEATEKGMFQKIVESVDMYGTKHTLKNQKGEKV